MAPQLQLKKRQVLTGLFALTLIASIFLGTASPIHPQATSPSSEEALREEIRALAESDVQDDIPRRTQFAINLYRDHPVGLSAPEIAKIYDKAYTQQVEAKKRDLQEIFKPENGYFIALLILVSGVVGVVLKDTLTQKVTGFFQAIDNWIYARFAGSQLFRGIALRRYQKALFEKYKDLRIPFRGNRPPLDMAEVYVPLKVEGATDREQIDAYGAIAQHHRLMVKGPPGSGKTMLLKHLALSYGAGRLNLPNWPVPVLLELHRLSDPELTQEKLIQAVVDAFNRNNFPKAERFVRQSLQQGTLMLLLDGLDEVNSTVRTNVIQQIKDLLNTYEQCRAIITCRKAVYRDDFANVTEQTLEVVEFSDQQIRCFLGAWEREMPPEKSIDQLMQTLRDRPRIMALARNPLLLTIISYLYTDTPFVLPHSRAEFYQKSTDILLEQWQRDFNIYRASDKRRVLQHLALYNQDLSSQRSQDLRSLDYTLVLKQVQQILPSLNLNQEVANSILAEIVERSGLLLRIDGGNRYQFAHRTLQEFFAATALIDDVDFLIQKFEHNSYNWSEVVKLWCGLAGNSTRLIEVVYQVNPLTALECLADAQEVDSTLAENIIEHCKTKLKGNDGDSEALTQAFGALASDFRSRGKEIFSFLIDIIESESEDQYVYMGARALAYTNLPKAASTLCSYYSRLPQIRSIIISMGDIAVPALVALAEKGYTEALDDLRIIGTPTAIYHLNKSNLIEVAAQAKERRVQGISNEGIDINITDLSGLSIGKRKNITLIIKNLKQQSTDIQLEVDETANYAIPTERSEWITNLSLQAQETQTFKFPLTAHRGGVIQLQVKVNGKVLQKPLEIIATRGENPYSYGLPVKASSFFGRESELESIFYNIYNDSNTLLIGEQRTGKTSLLFQTKELLKPPYIPVYVSLSGIPSKDIEALDWILKKIIEELKLSENFKNYDHSNKILDSNDFKTQLKRIVNHLKIETEENYRLELLIDEGNEMFSVEEVDTFQGTLRQSFIELGSELGVVWACYHSFFEDSQSIGSELHNIFDNLYIKPFHGKELEDLIVKPAKEFGYSYDTPAIEKVKEISGGHAFYCQSLCAHSWSQALASDAKIITKMHVEKGRDIVIESDRERFISGYWKRFREDEIRILKYLNLGDPIPQPDKKAIRKLKEKSFIEEQGSIYKFTCTLFRDWVHQLI